MKISIATIVFFVLSALTPLNAQSTQKLAGEKGDDFRKNLVTVLGEERARTWGLPTRLEIDPNRGKLYLTESFGEISVFDCETLNRIQTFTAHTQRCLDLALIDGGKQLVSVAIDGDVRLWDLQPTEPKLLDTFSMSDAAEPIWLTLSRAFKSKLFTVRSDKQLSLFEIQGDKITFRSDARSRNKQVPNAFGLSPDGRWLVTSETLDTSELVVVDGANHDYRDAKLFLWDLSERKPKPTFFTNCKDIARLYFLSDTQFVTDDPYVLSERKSQTWSIVNGQLRMDRSDATNSTIFGNAAVSADGKLKATTHEGIVTVFERRDDLWIDRAKFQTKQVFSMAFLGEDLITCARPMIQRWRWQDGKYNESTPPIGQKEHVGAIDFDRHGRGLISTSGVKMLHWPVSKGKYSNLSPTELTDDRALNEFNFVPVQRSMLNIKSTPTGNRVLFGRLFNERQNETQFNIDFGTDYRGAGWCAAVHPSKAIVATGHWDSKIRLWDIDEPSSPKMLLEWQAHNGHVCDVTFSPDGSTVASAGWDHRTKLWSIDYDSWKATAGLQLEDLAHTDVVRSVAYSANGKFLASGGEDGIVLLWDLKSGKRTPTVLAYPDSKTGSTMNGTTIGSLQFSMDGATLLTASGGGRVTQWNTGDGLIAQTWQLPGWIWHASYSPDEKTIATANNDGTVYILHNPLRE